MNEPNNQNQNQNQTPTIITPMHNNAHTIAIAKREAGIPDEIAVNSYGGWKEKGYQVQRGEHAAFKTSIWVPCHAGKNKDGEDTSDFSRFFIRRTAFFTAEQVAPITD